MATAPTTPASKSFMIGADTNAKGGISAQPSPVASSSPTSAPKTGSSTNNTYYYGKDAQGNPVYESSSPSGSSTGTNAPPVPALTSAKANITNTQNTPQTQPATGTTPTDSGNLSISADPNAPGGISGSGITAATPYQAGATALSQSGKPAPSNASDAKSVIKGTLPPPTPDTTVADTVLAANKALEKQKQDYQDSISTAKQGESLLQQYKDITKQLGIPEINTEMMNLHNIIQGTEDDIRNEVTKANGFATDSQILALTNARNKQNIINYNSLTQQRTDLMQQVTTMTGLAAQDRSYAMQQIDHQLNYDQKVVDFTQKAVTDARDSFQKTATTYGWNTILKSALASGDPHAIAQINSTMGNGFDLKSIAGETPLGSYQVVKGGTDSLGSPLPDRIFNSKTGQFTGQSGYGGSSVGNGGGTGASTNPTGGAPGSAPMFAKYGLLANTNFNASNLVDNLAQKYLDQYIKNGNVPTASSLGRNMKPDGIAQVDSRARELYYQATGSSMPNPELIKGYQAQLTGNNKLLNNLNVQEGTIGKNAALLLQNVNANNLNQNIPAINGFIDGVRNMLGDPAVAQYLAQNVTVGNELGSLLSLKNAQGTTVHDKLEAAGLIAKNDSTSQIASKVKVLLQEAVNAHDAIGNANADLYRQTDPLMQDSNNPLRAQEQARPAIEQAFAAQGGTYDHFVSATPAGEIPVLDKASGQIGYISPAEFSESKYTKI